MADPLVVASEVLAPAFAEIAGSSDVDPVVRPSDRADAQANGVLPLAKMLGRPPREVADEIVAEVRRRQASGESPDFGAVEVAGPGFLNITFADHFIAEQAAAMANDPQLGVRSAVEPQTVVIDYSAPNVAKEMHVGHLRTTVIGDALVRLHTFVGDRVVKENHIGDWGTPFGMLIEHLIDLGADAAAGGLSLGDLDGFYKSARAKFEADDSFKDRARRRVVSLQSGDDETMALWRLLVAQSTRHFNAVYDKLGVLLTDDDLMGESAYHELLPQVVDRLRDAGLLQESDGADVVFPAGFTNREGQPLPLIVQKGGGGFNYATSDLACVIDRVERVRADLILYVVGAPQSQHFQMVFAVAEMAGWLKSPTRAVHVSFGSVLGADRKMLKSRSGDPMKFIELVDESIERAKTSVDTKNPDLPAAERDAVAHSIGIGALKYAELSVDRQRDYVFDWDRMLSFDGDTGPYLQYAHARICSIFRRAEEQVGVARSSVVGRTPAAGEPQERSLVLRLLGFDAAVWEAIERSSPHRLCSYLYDLAGDFTDFYENCPILRAGVDERVRDARLALADLTARVLATGLSLLGIDAPERM
jgi:arginyl-tRNA synthetase